VFFRKAKTINRRGARAYNGSFLQPLAVGIVSAILVALILVMGYLDIRRNEANLVGFMEDQALTTISVLLRQTEDNLKSIAAAKGTIPSRLKTAKEAESAYSIQLVFDAITKLGQNIDELWKKKMLNNAYLRRFAAEHHFWYVAVLNMRGDMIYQSGPLKTDMLAKSDLFVKGRKATTLELLEKIRIRQDIGYAGVKLKSGGGIAIFCLDRKSRLYWSLKVAVERAMSKMGEGHGIAYLQVFNDQKILLGNIGELPAGLTS